MSNLINSAMENSSKKLIPHAVLVSSPGMGHLTPILGLANRLASLHSFKVTIFLVSSGGATHVPLRDDHYSSDLVSLLNIPAADISDTVDPGAHVVTQICTLMRETAPSVRAAISGLLLPPTVVVLDMFATDYLPIARELALPAFVFVANAWCLAYLTHCPVLDKELQGDFVDQTLPLIQIPGGFKPVRPDDVMEPTARRNQPQYTEFLRIGAQIPLFDGVISRTWQDVEGPTLTALREQRSLVIYDIGPVVVAEPYESRGESDGMLMEWLDHQPPHSVIYVSFGSGGTLSTAQTNEVALGLELSQQRFIWVLRPPMDNGDASGTYLGLKADVDNIDSYLPCGFRERTHGVGWLVSQWAPQSKVLAHPSVGGFWTHCGWNSIMESLSRGVPMMAWPMYAEQRMNAALIVEELEVAIRTCGLPGKTLVGREDIGKTVRDLLEGRRMRLRAKELQMGASQALTPNGSSTKRLSELVQTLKMWTMSNSEHHLG